MKKRLIGILLSFALMLTMMPALGLAAPSYADTMTGVKYLDANGVEQTCEIATVVTSSTTTLTGGWYVVSGNVTINGDSWVSLSGDAHLILCDGAVLTLQKGVKEDTHSGVDNNLTIYVQSVGSDMGRFTAGSDGDNTNIFVDNITINGGVITAEGREAGISANTGVTINGGNVTASGRAHGIYGFNYVTIKDGTVTASGTGESGVGIGSHHDAGGEGTININGGNVTAIGNSIAIYHKVWNRIDATGWNNTAGEGAGEAIETSTTGQDLSKYKMVTFPAVYPLWVGGVRVTSENKDDVLGDADEGARVKYNPETRTLTLTDAEISGYYKDEYQYTYNIYSKGINLTIVLNGDNTVRSTTPTEYAIFTHSNDTQNGRLTIEGSGTLTAHGDKSAIYTVMGCKIKSGQIKATSKHDFTITAYGGCEISGGKVDATANYDNAIYTSGDLIISGGEVNAKADNDAAIFTYGDCKISGGNVNASGAFGGIYATNSVIASGGAINAIGNEDRGPDSQSVSVSEHGPTVGITAENIEVKNGINSLTAIGADVAVNGTMKNEIAGTGWKDAKGTEGKSVIAVGSYTADKLKGYKKVQFVAEPEPAPAVNVPVVTTTAKTSTRSTTIKWTWNTVDGTSKYKVAYHKVGSKKWKVKTTKKTKYVLKGHKIRGLYEYKVAAVTASGDVWSDVSCRYFKGAKIRAKAGTGTISVKWKKDKGATGYEVLVAKNKKMRGAQIYKVAPTAKSYKVTGLAKGKYFVKVRPMKNHGGVTYKGVLSGARKVKVN